MTTSQPLRTFIAIVLPVNIARELAAIQQRLRAQGLKMQWVKSGNIHLTLKFLGEIPPADVRKVESAMQTAARGVQPFALTVQGLGVFPGIRRPRVLWSGLGGETEQLGHLHRSLEDALAGQGIAREKRPFKGHLTLARIKRTPDSRQLLSAIASEGMFEPFSLPVNKLVLFQSCLQPTGAVYTPLADVRFGG